jgi:hypothetical protein
MKNWDFDQIISHATKMQEKINSLEAEVLKLKTPFDVIKQPHDIRFSYYQTDVVHPEKIKTNYEKALTLAKENDIINAHNREVVSKLKKTIVATGFSETRSEWKRNKMTSVSREWTNDIIATQGVGSAEVERRYLEFLKAVEQHELKELADKERKEREGLAALEEKKKEIAFVDLCRDLGVDPLTTTSDDLLENLLSRCKYLRLAYAGQATRGDWSDGPWRVSNALSKFEVITKLDEDIHKEYSEILQEFEDGRSFRDCEYNYDVLFDMVDPKLMTFYERLVGVKDSW